MDMIAGEHQKGGNIMKKYRRIIFGCFVTGLVALIIYCAVNPVTGKKELMFFSVADELALGKETDQQVQQDIPVIGILEAVPQPFEINTPERKIKQDTCDGQEKEETQGLEKFLFQGEA